MSLSVARLGITTCTITHRIQLAEGEVQVHLWRQRREGAIGHVLVVRDIRIMMVEFEKRLILVETRLDRVQVW
jgi:hypothetical protein